MLSRTAHTGEDKAHFLRKAIPEEGAEALIKKKASMSNSQFCFAGLNF